jgi:hypothetical protein
MQKTFKNDSGDIVVRESSNSLGCGIVEMMHLWHDNESGCVIGFWETRDRDGEKIAEFKSLDERFPKTEYSFDVMEAVKYGQSLAELLLKSDRK